MANNASTRFEGAINLRLGNEEVAGPKFDASDLLRQGNETGLFGWGSNHPTNRKGNRLEFIQSIVRNFEVIDANEDNSFSKSELNDFIETEDIHPKDREAAQVLRDHFDKIEDFDDGFKEMLPMTGENPFWDGRVTKADLHVLALSLAGPSVFERQLNSAKVSSDIRTVSSALFGFAVAPPLIGVGLGVGWLCSGPIGWAGVALAAGATIYPAVKMLKPLTFGLAESYHYRQRVNEVASWKYFAPLPRQ